MSRSKKSFVLFFIIITSLNGQILLALENGSTFSTVLQLEGKSDEFGNIHWLDNDSLIYTRSTGEDWDHTPFTLNPTNIFILDIQTGKEKQITHSGTVDEIINCFNNNTILFKVLEKHKEKSVVDQQIREIYSVQKKYFLLDLKDLSVKEIDLPKGIISPDFDKILQQGKNNLKIFDLASMTLLDTFNIPVGNELQIIKWLPNDCVYIGCKDENMSPTNYVYHLHTKILLADTLLTDEEKIFNNGFQMAPNLKWYSATKTIDRNSILYCQDINHQNIYIISSNSVYGVWSPDSRKIAYIEIQIDQGNNLIENLKVAEFIH